MLARRAQRLSQYLGTPSLVRFASHAGAVNRPGLRRSGQNLSNRYKRLEKSLRGKQELSHEIEDFERISDTNLSNAAPKSEDIIPAASVSPRAVPLEETFHGFKIPKEPKPPADDECCMSGCAICVYDLYDESLEEYRKSISTLRASLNSMGIPRTEWPESLRESAPPTGGGAAPAKKSTQEVALNAFEEMERALAAKKVEQSKTIDVSGQSISRTLGQPIVPTSTSTSTSRASRRNPIPPPPPPTLKEKMTDLAEGLRWLLFSNR